MRPYVAAAASGYTSGDLNDGEHHTIAMVSDDQYGFSPLKQTLIISNLAYKCQMKILPSLSMSRSRSKSSSPRKAKPPITVRSESF